ncbi:hypothetical protein SAMN02910413_0277 [Pseudobutyrivibrio sp. C4]|uniref:hypothetical protein n=1 Tax=Pseudobutyrivibrio sp. C4 TaxID=1520803 RepID=UPI0008D528EB|nr:hypothetical protein [Pseudobutyrivibrio sp. C4]SES64805.1 hypothetical protein SAMN02910413_0277 [Pseudobutyrivibrio sp. C4]
MEKEFYQRKINDIITKCPIEAGVEILVYRLLDECIDDTKLSLVDINRIWKNQDERLITDGGVPDIAVLSNDFVFKDTDKGKCYGFVEVKSTEISLRETEKFLGESKNVEHFIYTNGLVWKYYKGNELKKEYNLIKGKKLPYSVAPVEIDEDEFYELQSFIRTIKWND